ncbi:hypothetical protein COOONC_25900 [Cooperia oncophora]
MAIAAPSRQGANLCTNQASLIKIALICLVISSAVQLLLPVINEYGKWLFFFGHSLCQICNGTNSRELSLPANNDPIFFPEIFPVETWTGAKPVAVIRAISEDELPDHAREQEALVALSAAQSSRQSGNIKRVSCHSHHTVQKTVVAFVERKEFEVLTSR